MSFSNTKIITRERDTNIYIDNIKMYTVSKIRFLGVYIFVLFISKLINNTLYWSNLRKRYPTGQNT